VAEHQGLQAAGITRDTKDPAGGRIERDADGNPTGVLVDKAMALVNDVIRPTPTTIAVPRWPPPSCT
jgi:predicted amidohydrolase YtcJ